MERKKTRAGYVMVAEDDPQWERFWDAYPRRCAKKEARKAWAQVNPSAQLVDTMLDALAWQVPAYRWDSDKADYAPYPASWLRAERWTDERPKPPTRPTRKPMSDAAATVFEALGVKP